MMMKPALVALGLATLLSTQAAAQTPPPTPAAASSGALSVDGTPIGEIIKNPKAKAVIETALPTIEEHYDDIRGMTLAQVKPMSDGKITDEKLKEIQAAFDKVNAGR